MNQSWPHYQGQVILPELVCNYSDMPIQRHVCESSFFLPVEQLYKTTGGVARQRGQSCKLTMYMPKMNRILASLRSVCPICTSPLPARPLQRFPGWLSIILAICIRPLIGAVGFQLTPTSLITLKVALAETRTMAINITNAIQRWVRSL